jgi:23S rRNA U2552 (ribose-2'-O)-methylase RlmE/FtsJ
MSYYLINFNHNVIEPQDFSVKMENNIQSNKLPIFISPSLHKYLTKIKEEIDKYIIQWDSAKKIINPYEFIHSHIYNQKQAVAKTRPISRSYFKFIEISQMLSILDKFISKPITSFHLAEGPGGFIEAISHLRKRNDDQYYGMTLLSENNNVPGWKKSQHFIGKHPNVTIVEGEGKDGDLLNPVNLKYCANKFGNSMEIITGDGGFDYSIDFNKQELLSTKLIFSQMCYALVLQKKGGNFILKMFDIFFHVSCQMIYVLNCFYEKVYIVKPNTSRFANSERYIVAKHFKFSNTQHYVERFTDLIKQMQHKTFLIEFPKISIPCCLFIKLEEINGIIGQQQLDAISSTLALIEKNSSESMDSIIYNHVQKCIQWCLKHKVPFNKLNFEVQADKGRISKVTNVNEEEEHVVNNL